MLWSLVETTRLPSLILLRPSRIATETFTSPWADEAFALMATAAPSTSGVILSESMWTGATGSSHTVCQMPVVGVYQMPRGLRTCFPRGWFRRRWVEHGHDDFLVSGALERISDVEGESVIAAAMSADSPCH